MKFKEWFLENEIPEIRGEYWIDEHGGNMYADGDIGDRGHEAHVIDIVQRQIIDSMGDYGEFDRGEYIDWDAFVSKLANDTIEEKHLNPDEVDEDEIVRDAMKEQGIDDDTIYIAYGRGDAREYAMKHWGWKAVRGHDIESWTLTPQDMKIIARGIEDILDGEGAEEGNDDEMEFYVSSYKHPARTMTLRELRAGAPDAISAHATQVNIMQKPLQMQADKAIKDTEIQSMHPYYQGKEQERDLRNIGLKTGGSKPNPTAVAMQKAGYIKPGQKWWALRSEGLK